MAVLTKSKQNLKIYSNNEYKAIISDLLRHPAVLSMEEFIQHGDISCLSHSINVSYHSYIVCKYLKLDFSSAARGGLLHDLFLYDWHLPHPEKGLHGFTHPYTALENANKYFVLNHIEIDIIKKHMWPLTLKLPRCKEAFIVCFVDKYCALTESLKRGSNSKLYNIKNYLFFEK